jgi:periplasmic copper chaperone A
MSRAVLSTLFLSVLFVASAHAAQADHIIASHAWIRLLPGNLPAAGYVVLQNNDATAVTLNSVQTTAYASAMIHQSTHDASGMERMSMLDRLTIPAHSSLSLAPNSYHLMLEQASHPLKVGDSVDITLRFSDGSQLPVSFLVRPANALDTD